MPMTALPTPPSRQDPTNFAARADTLMAALPGFVTEANALQADVGAKQTSAAADAATAIAKAGEAAAARDIAMAAVNYHGLWSSLSGALAIPASVYHSGSVWLLKESLANVATETPGVSTKWLNVTPASGLGTAAYADETDFQPAIGALTGLLISAGGGTISAATAAQIVAAIGSVYVANATHATSASSADVATSVMDGAINAAVKVANNILTGAKFAPNTIPFTKLVREGTAGKPLLSGGPGADFYVGDFPASGVTSVGGNGGDVTNAEVAASAAAGNSVAAGTKYYLPVPGSTYGTSQVEIANFKMHSSGSVRFYIDMTTGGNYNSIYVYKNGIYTGINAAGTALTNFTLDATFVEGDTIQIQAVTSSGSGTINFILMGVTALAILPLFTQIPAGVR